MVCRSLRCADDAQIQGWEAISEGRHTLVSAPTGSGKTLAAFLTCLDALVRSALNVGLPERTRIVYVSPHKALANDIQRNLVEPLAEINTLADEAGTPLPEIRVGVRTGDTPACERAKMAKTPPHILITTPGSLYLLLTSQSGRVGLWEVDTLILDELHAVADDKRGSHLSLTVERLCSLSVSPITRIGLSATQRPITDMARLLVGARHTDIDGTSDCTIVDAGHARNMDLALEMPEDELGPIATHDLWSHTLDRIAELVNQHGTTLLFVNTRRLVKRLAFQLSDRLGEESVVLHHGSQPRLRLAGEFGICTAIRARGDDCEGAAVDSGASCVRQHLRLRVGGSWRAGSQQTLPGGRQLAVGICRPCRLQYYGAGHADRRGSPGHWRRVLDLR